MTICAVGASVLWRKKCKMSRFVFSIFKFCIATFNFDF